VPTARHRTFTATDQDAALAFLHELAPPYVVKTDGLAAGKGVAVTGSLADARDHVRAYLSGDAFGDAGRTLVIEEGLVGPEMSLLVLCDGREAVPFEPAQDFKRVFDADQGPNTGGMGAYSPVPVAPPEVVDEIMAKAVRPTLYALQTRGIEYRGILYAGVMLTAQGPKVIEYNVRFGDPECEAVVPRLASELYAHCVESACGHLETDVRFRDDAAVTVVLAVDGYPTAPRTGDPIEGLDRASEIDGVVVFHAGTKADGDRLCTAGGRALAVTATAETLVAARAKAYDAAALITWPGVHYRRDIALAAVSGHQ
jgi:phosphoribosylamine---glycine ligase